MSDRPRYRAFVHDSIRWEGFAFREDDIVISTAPKSGTTWMQMMCALLILRTPELPAPLAVLSPWLDMQTRPLDEVVHDLEQQQHRRFIKTHTPLDGLPFDPSVTYLHVARDPRDVAMSWGNHMANLDMERMKERRFAVAGTDDLAEMGLDGPPPPPPEDPAERFWSWMEGGGRTGHVSGLEGLVHHTATFWDRRNEPNVHLFHYSDLRADLRGQMERLAGILGVAEPDDELVEAATFERMKAQADLLVPNSDLGLWQDNSQFFERARSGDWQELMADGGQQRYETVLTGLASSELARWIQHGWLGTD